LRQAPAGVDLEPAPRGPALPDPVFLQETLDLQGAEVAARAYDGHRVVGHLLQAAGALEPPRIPEPGRRHQGRVAEDVGEDVARRSHRLEALEAGVHPLDRLAADPVRARG